MACVALDTEEGRRYIAKMMASSEYGKCLFDNSLWRAINSAEKTPHSVHYVSGRFIHVKSTEFYFGNPIECNESLWIVPGSL